MLGVSESQQNTNDVLNNTTSAENQSTTSDIVQNQTVDVTANSTENNRIHGSTPENDAESSSNHDVLETNRDVGPDALDGVTMPLRCPEAHELDTLPDLVLNSKPDGKKTDDTNEVADALLQLSQSDILPEDNSELPIGILPVDTAPVPIALGNEDVLNAIENFKQNNNEPGRLLSANDYANTEHLDDNNNEKENKEVQKSHESGEKESKQTAGELTKPTSPSKRSLVIVKHGIKRKKSSGCTYKCT